MGKFLVLLTYLGSLKGVGPDYQNAADNTRRALMEDKVIKADIDHTTTKVTDAVESWSERRLGVHKEDLVYAAYAAPLVLQKVSTKPFKNLKCKFYGFTIRPEIEYTFKENEQEVFRGILFISKEF